MREKSTEAYSNRNHRYEYNYGSAAPQRVEESPVRIRRQTSHNEEELRRERQELRAAENRRSAAKFGFVYTLVIVAAVAAMALCCVNYISAINEHSNNTKKINSLTSQVTELTQLNDEKKLAIDTSIDYDYIYYVAVKELGMVYPGAGQIIHYVSGENEYVIQYRDFK